MELGPVTRAEKAEQENRELRDRLAVEEKRVKTLAAEVERLRMKELGIAREPWAGTD